jgi:hypothetical protein
MQTSHAPKRDPAWERIADLSQKYKDTDALRLGRGVFRRHPGLVIRALSSHTRQINQSQTVSPLLFPGTRRVPTIGLSLKLAPQKRRSAKKG